VKLMVQALRVSFRYFYGWLASPCTRQINFVNSPLSPSVSPLLLT